MAWTGRSREAARDAGKYGLVPRTRTAALLAVLVALLLLGRLLLRLVLVGSEVLVRPLLRAVLGQRERRGGTDHRHLPVAHPTVWLCRPGMANNPCEGGLDATDVGSRQRPDRCRRSSRPPNPKIDCFYVYPTLSEAKSINAPLAPEPAADRCRPLAGRPVRLGLPPVRPGLPAADARLDRQRQLRGTPRPRRSRPSDVDSAWHDYLNHDNQGRGRRAHRAQPGRRSAERLIRSEIDNNPAERSKLVSALLLGGNVLVPQGKDVGGIFANVPACRQDRPDRLRRRLQLVRPDAAAERAVRPGRRCPQPGSRCSDRRACRCCASTR